MKKIFTKNFRSRVKLTILFLFLFNIHYAQLLLNDPIIIPFKPVNQAAATNKAVEIPLFGAAGIYTFSIRTTGNNIVFFDGTMNGQAFQSSLNQFINCTPSNPANIQLGYSLLVTNSASNCNNYKIEYKITDMIGRTILDWSGINLKINENATTQTIANQSTYNLNVTNTPDLYLRDNALDRGEEPFWMSWWRTTPNPTAADITQSNDIWNRNKLTTPINRAHENPMNSIATPLQNANYNYVTVRNRSCVATPASNLNLYWTIARVWEPWQKDWEYFGRQNVGINNYVTFPIGSNDPKDRKPLGAEHTIVDKYDLGSAITPISIGSFTAGETKDVYMPWIVPDPKWYVGQTQWPLQFHMYGGSPMPVICMLARLNETWRPNRGNYFEPLPAAATSIVDYVSQNNNIVTRNTFIVNSTGGYIVNPTAGRYRGRTGIIAINNPTTRNYINLSIRNNDTSESRPNFTNNGRILVYLDQLTWYRWLAGGMQGTNIDIEDEQILSVNNGDIATIDNIQLKEDEQGYIALQNEYNEYTPPENDYDYSYAVGAYEENPLQQVGSPSHFYASVLSVPRLSGENINNQKSTVDDIANTDKIKVFPNPAKDYIFVNTSSNNNIEITLYNIEGKAIKVFTDLNYISKTTDIKLDIAEINAGVYLLKVKTEESIHTSKIIIE